MSDLEPVGLHLADPVLDQPAPARQQIAAQPVDQADLELVVQHRLDQALDAGHPPSNVQAWKRAAAKTELDNERTSPGYIARAAAGLRARTRGQRITGWREVRGSHGMDWVPDPNGTATPPPGYRLP